uniref:Fe2OG dioxygenase domain-containing protein n=1 Tax=Noctiluca scintillans TaxID=2966 RepID=A0A7S1F6M8_NOCSC
MTLLSLESELAKVWLIEDLISDEEQETIMQSVGEMNFTTSPTERADGQEWRSSSSVYSFPDEVFGALVRRVAVLCGVPENFVERPQVVRYLPGEKYHPHMDSGGPDHRHWTVLLYLNDPGGGGSTAFPLLKLQVVPAPRAAVFWQNLRPVDGESRLVRNYNTVHEGRPPTSTTPKYAVNIWVWNKSREHHS